MFIKARNFNFGDKQRLFENLVEVSLRAAVSQERSLSVEPVQVVTLCAKVTCTGMNGVEIMTRVPRRHEDRHGESKDTSPKISNKSRLYLPFKKIERCLRIRE